MFNLIDIRLICPYHTFGPKQSCPHTHHAPCSILHQSLEHIYMNLGNMGNSKVPFCLYATCITRCLNFFHLQCTWPNHVANAKFRKYFIYSSKFFLHFHLFKSSFTCPGQMGKCEDCAMFFVFGEIVQKR